MKTLDSVREDFVKNMIDFENFPEFDGSGEQLAYKQKDDINPTLTIYTLNGADFTLLNHKKCKIAEFDIHRFQKPNYNWVDHNVCTSTVTNLGFHHVGDSYERDTLHFAYTKFPKQAIIGMNISDGATGGKEDFYSLSQYFDTINSFTQKSYGYRWNEVNLKVYDPQNGKELYKNLYNEPLVQKIDKFFPKINLHNKAFGKLLTPSAIVCYTENISDELRKVATGFNPALPILKINCEAYANINKEKINSYEKNIFANIKETNIKDVEQYIYCLLNMNSFNKMLPWEKQKMGYCEIPSKLTSLTEKLVQYERNDCLATLKSIIELSDASRGCNPQNVFGNAREKILDLCNNSKPLNYTNSLLKAPTPPSTKTPAPISPYSPPSQPRPL